MNYGVYDREIVKPLQELHSEKKGIIIGASDDILGLSVGNDQSVLVTSCHHGSEIYST